MRFATVARFTEAGSTYVGARVGKPRGGMESPAASMQMGGHSLRQGHSSKPTAEAPPTTTRALGLRCAGS